MPLAPLLALHMEKVLLLLELTLLDHFHGMHGNIAAETAEYQVPKAILPKTYKGPL